MAKKMKQIFIISVFGTMCFWILYNFTKVKFLLPCTITFGTTAYHFGIRLLIGECFNRKMQNKADYTKRWYQVGSFEQKFYQKIKVKQWKNKMPTYDTALFDISKHSWDEIVQVMCQAELVHETNMIFSFFPVVTSIWFDSFWVFFITSLLGAIFDLLFVFMQRYNRSRILKMKRKSLK